MNNIAKLIAFDVSSERFDANFIAENLKNLTGSDVWNFVPGIFVIKNEQPWAEIAKKLVSIPDFPNFLAIGFDPAHATGNLPPAAWDSWFLNLFSSEIDRAAEVNGWTPSYVAKVKAYQERKKQR